MQGTMNVKNVLSISQRSHYFHISHVFIPWKGLFSESLKPFGQVLSSSSSLAYLWLARFPQTL